MPILARAGASLCPGVLSYRDGPGERTEFERSSPSCDRLAVTVSGAPVFVVGQRSDAWEPQTGGVAPAPLRAHPRGETIASGSGPYDRLRFRRRSVGSHPRDRRDPAGSIRYDRASVAHSRRRWREIARRRLPTPAPGSGPLRRDICSISCYFSDVSLRPLEPKHVRWLRRQPDANGGDL
jgi:hypothetical protein